MTATSSQRLNLRPTSRSTPTSSNPQAAWSAREAVAAGLDPGHDGVEAAGRGHVDHVRSSSARPDAVAVVVPAHVDRVLDRGPVGRPLLVGRQGRRSPTTLGRPRPATTARKAPERAASHARWSSRRARDQVERGRRASRPRGCRCRRMASASSSGQARGAAAWPTGTLRTAAPDCDADGGRRRIRYAAAAGLRLCRARPLSSVGRALPW